jgi:hypothetical protein
MLLVIVGESVTDLEVIELGLTMDLADLADLREAAASPRRELRMRPAPLQRKDVIFLSSAC